MQGLLIFFTLWNVLVVLFHKQLYKNIHLIYLTYITCIVGTYLAHYNPRYFDFVLLGKSYRLEGWYKILGDVMHLIPFLFVYCLYHKYYKNEVDDIQIVNAIVLLLIYVVLLDIKSVYGVPFKELFVVFMIASALFFLLSVIEF